MSNRFANGRKAFGFCDVCGFRFDLKRLKNLVVKTKETQIKACPQCWTPDQPQLQLGMYPIADPQAIRDPRPDTNTWFQSGVNALNNVSEGMLVIQWGWAPIGGARDFTDPLTPNTLVGVGQVGQVTFAPWTSVLFTTPGTYSWTAPVGVTQVYVLCVGGGGSGGPVAGTGNPGVASSFDTFFAGGGGAGASTGGGAGGTGTTLSATVFGGNGGAGSNRVSIFSGGGGGAGGYAGNGGNGGSYLGLGGVAGTGGGAGGGGAFLSYGVGGGGVGLSGQGANGTGGGFGGGGSGGETSVGQNGALYGGGGGGSGLSASAGGGGGGGGLRWTFLTVTPGTTYPVVVGAGGVVANSGSGGGGAVRINYLPVP
jgi:hypothetical protein